MCVGGNTGPRRQRVYQRLSDGPPPTRRQTLRDRSGDAGDQADADRAGIVWGDGVISRFHNRLPAIDISSSRFAQCVRDPLIYRLRPSSGCIEDFLVKVGTHSQSEISRKWFLGFLISFRIVFQEIIDAIVKGLQQVFSRRCFVGHNIPDSDNTTMENKIVLVEFNRSGISLVRSHGVTFAFSRKSRTSRTVWRFVSGFGCGR